MSSKKRSVGVSISENDENFIKVVVVGDGTIGKTCMCLVYANNDFPQGYIPTIFENYTVKVNVQDKMYKISLFDTAGQEGYDRLRILSYPATSVFLVCFALDQYSTFENVSQAWVPELRRYNPTTPIVLVGTKSDIHNRTNVTREQGKTLAKKIGAAEYVECSALKNEGIKNVFDAAICAALRKSRDTNANSSSCCNIL